MRLLLLSLAMESGLLALRTSSSIGRVQTDSLGSLTPILFTLHCAMSSFFQLDRWDGTLAFVSLMWKISQTQVREQLPLWKNTFAIASTFALLILSPTISSLLESSSRHMFVRLGQLLSRSALHNLLLYRTILELSFIRA